MDGARGAPPVTSPFLAPLEGEPQATIDLEQVIRGTVDNVKRSFAKEPDVRREAILKATAKMAKDAIRSIVGVERINFLSGEGLLLTHTGRICYGDRLTSGAPVFVAEDQNIAEAGE